MNQKRSHDISNTRRVMAKEATFYIVRGHSIVVCAGWGDQIKGGDVSMCLELSRWIKVKKGMRVSEH